METSWFKKIRSKDPAVRRQGLLELYRSGHPRTEEVLEYLMRKDPDETLRKLARRALGRLQGAEPAPDAESPEPDPTPRPTKSPDTNLQERATDREERTQAVPPQTAGDRPPPSPPSQFGETTKERAELNRAVSHYTAGRRAEAVRTLRQALVSNPYLKTDRLAQNLASELTGQPGESAIEAISAARTTSEVLVDEEASEPSGPNLRGMVMTLLLAMSLVVLIAVTVWFVRAGYFNNYIQAIRFASYRADRNVLGTTEYYLITPSGEAPETGWPLLVALHGYGGRARDMLGLAQLFTDRGVAFLAPTFGSYQPNPGPGPIPEMRDILRSVGQSAPVQSDGAVLFGFSQGGSFAYRFSAYHPELVSGVVTAGAPQLDPVPPPSQTMPYVFTWGQQDGLQEFLLPTVLDLQRAGFNVRYQIVEGAGHEVTPFSLEEALRLLGRGSLE